MHAQTESSSVRCWLGVSWGGADVVRMGRGIAEPSILLARLQAALLAADDQQGHPRSGPRAAHITEFSGWSIVRKYRSGGRTMTGCASRSGVIEVHGLAAGLMQGQLEG